MAKQFWAVKWGHTVRISVKCETLKEACKDCYGMVADNMLAKPLGTRRAPLRTDKYRKMMLESADGWQSPPKGTMLI